MHLDHTEIQLTLVLGGIDEVEATTPPPTSSPAESPFPVKKTKLQSKAYDIFRLPLTPCEIDALDNSDAGRDDVIGRLEILAGAFLVWNKDLQAVVAETEELRKELTGVRKQIKALSAKKAASDTVVDSINASVWTETQVKETAAKLAVIAHKEIKKQMKWQPSCKRGSSKWSYTATVPDAAVLFALFNLEAGGKKWKQKKLTLNDFQEALGDIEASCRYNCLRVTGEHVNLRFDSEALAWSVSGTYGI